MTPHGEARRNELRAQINDVLVDHGYGYQNEVMTQAIMDMLARQAQARGADEWKFVAQLDELIRASEDYGRSPCKAFENDVKMIRNEVIARYRSLPAAEPATVPFKGEREIAEIVTGPCSEWVAVHDAITNYKVGAVDYDTLTDAIAALATHAARTVTEKGVAWDVEAMAQALHDPWDHGVTEDINQCRKLVRVMLAAGTGGE